MKHFAEYVAEQKRRAEEEERSKKVPREPDDKKNCCVCLCLPAACAFVPCGHMVTCRTCAREVEKSDGCPICRAGIAMVLDIYT